MLCFNDVIKLKYKRILTANQQQHLSLSLSYSIYPFSHLSYSSFSVIILWNFTHQIVETDFLHFWNCYTEGFLPRFSLVVCCWLVLFLLKLSQWKNNILFLFDCVSLLCKKHFTLSNCLSSIILKSSSLNQSIYNNIKSMSFPTTHFLFISMVYMETQLTVTYLELIYQKLYTKHQTVINSELMNAKIDATSAFFLMNIYHYIILFEWLSLFSAYIMHYLWQQSILLIKVIFFMIIINFSKTQVRRWTYLWTLVHGELVSVIVF